MKHRIPIGLLVVLALAGASACSSSNNPAGSTPTGPNSIAFSTTPVSGSTVSIGRCGSYFPPACTSSVLTKSDVTVNQAVSGPLLKIAFQKDDGTECLYTFPNNPASGSYPGGVVYLTTQMNIADNPIGSLNRVCTLPYTTTKAVVTLYSGNSINGAIVIQQTFAYPFSWIE